MSKSIVTCAQIANQQPQFNVQNGLSCVQSNSFKRNGGAVHELSEVLGSIESLMDAVVKVFCVHTKPDYSRPWQMERQYSSTSTGFIIEGRRVLTNAHSIEYHTHVKLKKRGSDTKYVATVLAIGNECDLALLTVSDEEFWDGVSPIEFGELPALQDAVTVIGYPIGGDNISVTSGIVSRVDILSYTHGSTDLLGLQIDAAINPGNSGGPAFNHKGVCVGVAFQSLKEDADNIGYVIPTSIIMHFIQDYQNNGAYTGFPLLGIDWQPMENPDLRMAMGMESKQKGILIRRVEPTSFEYNVLQASDVILSFDGVDIANDGTVPFRHGERIGCNYLISKKFIGDNAEIKLLREFVIHKIDIKLGTYKSLCPGHDENKAPSYYIIAGFVVVTMSLPYVQSEDVAGNTIPIPLLNKLMDSKAQSKDEELVIVSQVLVADINIGYEEISNTQILAFNKKPVKNLRSFVQMVESCEEEFMKIELESEQVVILRTKTAKAATMDILSTHCIPSTMSNDLKN